jgi:hypothetical protein
MKLKRVLFAVFVAGVCAAMLYSQAAAPYVGTWKLNLAKSKYDPANLAPRSQTQRNEAVQGGVKTTVDQVDYQGKTVHSEYSAQFDSKDYPVKGDPNRDTIAIMKVDDYTFEATNKKAGKVATTNRTVYSRDGKSRTVTTTGTNAQGQKVTNIQFYDRQ